MRSCTPTSLLSVFFSQYEEGCFEAYLSSGIIEWLALIEEGHAYDYHGGKKKDFKAEAKKEIDAEKVGKSKDLVDKPSEDQ